MTQEWRKARQAEVKEHEGARRTKRDEKDKIDWRNMTSRWERRMKHEEGNKTEEITQHI